MGGQGKTGKNGMIKEDYQTIGRVCVGGKNQNCGGGTTRVNLK